MPKTQFTAPDLARQPPRSPRIRLGGFALLPRVLDKCRAVISGCNGEYKYACPLDQRFFDFSGINPTVMKKQVAKGLGDGAVLDWVTKNSNPGRSMVEIIAWSRWLEDRPPMDAEGREYFNNLHQKAGPQREDIGTWFELLDLDDYVSFGGKA